MLPTRIVAAVLALLGVLPLWQLLPQRATGLAGAATAEQAAAYTALVWNGVLLALIPAIIAALVLDSERFDSLLRRAAASLMKPSLPAYAFIVAIVGTLLAAFVGIRILQGSPALIDSFAQLVHARYFAAGSLAGPVGADQQFWHIQQTIATPKGWVSQYPPGYIALLAVGLKLHAVTLVGPLLLGVAVFFTALTASEVFENAALGRFAALLAALCPFMLGQAGAFMSHVPACAFSAMALYFVLRARRGTIGWSAAAGVALGTLFAIRPFTALVAGAVTTAVVVSAPMQGKLRRIAVALASALPLFVLVGLYNARFFGQATRFGYTAALGPHAGLGFGIDPWGNRFGLIDALAYTSAELAALNVFLLETPLPLVLFVGLFFARSQLCTPPQLLLFWWVAALVIANLFYWHHGLFMGPRMLADAGTLWVLLVVMSVAGLIGSIRADWLIGGKYSVRVFAAAGASAALLAGLFVFAPQRLYSYAPTADVERLLHAPSTDRAALVFVHGGWTTRIAMKLAAHGMRLDSVETALRQNGTCTVHNYALAYVRGEPAPGYLDFAPRATHLPPVIQIAPGDRIRIERGERIDAGCAAEMAADTAGVIDVSPFLWQGDLPAIGRRGALFVRDMGPAANADLIARNRDREPLMLIEKSERVSLQPYHAAARSVWSDR